MSKGERFKEHGVSFKDPMTGQPVIRLTGLENHCHHPYFYCRLFSPDAKRLLYVSHRDGKPDACLVNIENFESVQLTDSPAMDGFLLSLSADGKSLFFVEGPLLKKLDLATLEETLVYEQKPPYDGVSVYPGFSPDDKMVLLAQMHRDDVIKDKSGWDAWAPQCLANPRCRLMLVNIETGEERVVHEERCWLGHPQLRPGDSNTIMFCHEGPPPLISTRIWLIGADGSNMTPVKLSMREKNPELNTKEVVTHEFFSPDGARIECVYLPGDDGSRGHIFTVDLKSRCVEDLGEVSDYLHFSHAPVSDYIVGDQCGKGPKDRNCLWLFNMKTHKETPLCLHGSSYMPHGKSTQDAHAHPAFSPNFKYVAFSSDRETSSGGNCAVYLASTEGLI